MVFFKLPLVEKGQVYLHTALDEYVVVTANNRGLVRWTGPNFRGQTSVDTFQEFFTPVNPATLTDAEMNGLMAFEPVLKAGTTWIPEEEEEYV